MTQTAILLGANKETASRELEDVVKFEMKLANVRFFHFLFTEVYYKFFDI